MRTNVFLFFMLWICYSLTTIAQESIQKKNILLAKPTPEQLEFMDMEIGAFIHFTINTFTGDEHGDGGRDAKLFNPEQLDPEQWVRTAKSMGASYIVLTARHEDGFCLWPTKTTSYCLRNSPWEKGKGDIVGRFVDACRKYGIKPGLYFSPNYNGNAIFKPEDRPVEWGKTWDSITSLRYSDTALFDRIKKLEVEQVTELMTNYGPIYYLWMDHWGAPGYRRAEICRAVTDTVRHLQPHCILNGPDVITPGNEEGIVTYPKWNATNTEDGTVWTREEVKTADNKDIPNAYGLLETTMRGCPQGKFWRNVECPIPFIFFYKGWFWHDRLSEMPLDQRVDFYYRTVGLGANIIINLPPDQKGLISEETVTAVKSFGKEIKRQFSHFIAETKSVKSGDTIQLSWEEPCRIDHVMLMENIVNGQKIASYTLEAMIDGNWQALKSANSFIGVPKGFNASPGFETIGHKKIDRIEPVITNCIRFRCTKSIIRPVEIRKFTVWNCLKEN